MIRPKLRNGSNRTLTFHYRDKKITESQAREKQVDVHANRSHRRLGRRVDGLCNKKEISIVNTTELIEVEDFIPITVQEKPKPIERPKLRFNCKSSMTGWMLMTISTSMSQSVKMRRYLIITSSKSKKKSLKPLRNALLKSCLHYQTEKENFFEFISKNIRYSQLAHETRTQGRVFISFIVEPDGSISHVDCIFIPCPKVERLFARNESGS